MAFSFSVDAGQSRSAWIFRLFLGVNASLISPLHDSRRSPFFRRFHKSDQGPYHRIRFRGDFFVIPGLRMIEFSGFQECRDPAGPVQPMVIHQISNLIIRMIEHRTIEQNRRPPHIFSRGDDRAHNCAIKTMIPRITRPPITTPVDAIRIRVNISFQVIVLNLADVRPG